MRGWLREKLTYSNLVSTLCLFLLLGGGAYAATNLPKNSVGTRELQRNAVKTGQIARNAVRVGKLGFEAVKAGKLAKNAVPTNRLRDDAVTGAKLKEATLSTVPSAQTAQLADSITPPEGWHEVGAPGEPGFFNGWVNEGPNRAAYFKDREGMVHLKGFIGEGTGNFVFALPPGFRPAAGTTALFAIACEGAMCTSFVGSSLVAGSDVGMGLDGGVAVAGERASLDGISFRAES